MSEKKDKQVKSDEKELLAQESLQQKDMTNDSKEKKVYRSAHNTASAAHILAEGEEVDVRRKSGRKEKKIKTSKISYENKKKLYGYGFISIWLVGVLWLFINPLITSIHYAFSKTAIVDNELGLKKGMTGAGMHTQWIGFGNFERAFTQEPDYIKALTSSLADLAPKVILILVFSLFIAVILNQKFRGRTFVRSVFFLPVLIATGPIISVINGEAIATQGVADAEQFSALFKTDLVGELMTFMGLSNISPQFTEFIGTMTSDIFNLVWNSGIQILIFLAALQNIPRPAKEAAMIEGATAWEFFWKVTLPYISPMILANIVYTVIDAFIDPQNPVMEYVMGRAQAWEHGYAAALAWVYFLIVLAALAIVTAVVNKFVYYEVE